MKRKRWEMENQIKKTVIRSAIEELSMFISTKPADDRSQATNIHIRPLLSFCNLIIEALDKIGPTMAVLRQDIDQNIQRLEKLCESDPSVYSNLVEILKKERNEGNSKTTTSCSKAVLWLTRTMDFTAALLQWVAKDEQRSMEEAVEECYNATLKPWHGWISSAAFKVALKLLPDNNTLIDAVAVKDESFGTVKEDIKTLLSLLIPILDEVHTILESYGLNRLKST